MVVAGSGGVGDGKKHVIKLQKKLEYNERMRKDLYVSGGFEQINLINQLDEEDKSTVMKIIETMLTKKKFKDFFDKNVATL